MASRISSIISRFFGFEVLKKAIARSIAAIVFLRHSIHILDHLPLLDSDEAAFRRVNEVNPVGLKGRRRRDALPGSLAFGAIYYFNIATLPDQGGAIHVAGTESRTYVKRALPITKTAV
jgi:hypothetical protein